MTDDQRRLCVAISLFFDADALQAVIVAKLL
jgi:hypothetical protein